jgi:hypothetical protein
MTKLMDVSNLTRAEVVPYYTYLIISNPSDGEVKRVNDLILAKWSASGLLYIKEQAWKAAKALGYTFEKSWGDKTLDEMVEAIHKLRCTIDGTNICPHEDCDCKRNKLLLKSLVKSDSTTLKKEKV